VFAILLVIAMGALAAPQQNRPQQDQDRDRDGWRDRDRDRDGWRDRDRDRDRFRGGDREMLLILGYQRVTSDFGGGNGGRPAPDALCDPGFVAVGFHVQTGEFFNQAWLDCAPMRSDGSLGQERRMTSRTGSPGGRPVSDAYCSPGLALRGLRGRTGASIDEAAGECSSVREMAQRFGNTRTEMTQSVLRPRAGGHPAGAECPAGFVVTGFRSNSGEYMDHLWLVCSELQRSY
jgi:Ni/Co efflux regulator RcnB